MTPAPPQSPLQWDHSQQDITDLTKQAIEKYRDIMDAVGKLDPKDCNLDSVGLHPDAQWKCLIIGGRNVRSL